jgi:hypothetical protein
MDFDEGGTLMSRGASKDVPLTALLRAEGFFKDKRSFLGWRESVPHVYLKGEDMSRQRDRLMERDRYSCKKCGRHLLGDGEAHHVIPKGKGGSDDLENLEYRCGRFIGTCHTGEHVQTRFTRRVTSPIPEGAQ